MVVSPYLCSTVTGNAPASASVVDAEPPSASEDEAPSEPDELPQPASRRRPATATAVTRSRGAMEGCVFIARVTSRC